MTEVTKAVPLSEHTAYKAVVEASKAANEANDCTVRAVALATGIDYDKAHAALAEAGRVRRTGCNDGVWLEALKSLGFSGRLQKIEALAPTMKTIAPQLDERVNYIIVQHKHVAAYADGRVLDWSFNREKHVLAVYAVAPIGTDLPKLTARVKGERKIKGGAVLHAPREGSVGAEIWALADHHLGSDRDVIEKGEVKAFAYDLHTDYICQKTGEPFNLQNAKTELGLWCRFHGIDRQ